MSDERASTLSAADLAGRSRVVYSSVGWIELFDIAADGRVLLGRHVSQREALGLLAGFSEPRPLLVPGESTLARGITADGRAVLVSSHVTKDYEAFLIQSTPPGAVRLAAGDGMAISPDASRAITSSPDFRTFSVVPLERGSARTIPNPDRIAYETLATWLPDGRHFVVVGRQGSDQTRGYVCDVETGVGKPFGAPGVMWPLFTGPPVSPDGRFTVMQDAEGTPKRWPVDGGDPLPIPGVRPEDHPLSFTEDGRALLVAGRSLPVKVERLDLVNGRRTPWITIAPSDTSGLRYAVATIAANGKYWALSISKLLTDLYVVDGLR
jgi:hypothetical protein